MSADRVAERDDVLEAGDARLLARGVAVLVHELGLERVEEGLGPGVVQAAPGVCAGGELIARS